jgi:hypothetical protein
MCSIEHALAEKLIKYTTLCCHLIGQICKSSHSTWLYYLLHCPLKAFKYTVQAIGFLSTLVPHPDFCTPAQQPQFWSCHLDLYMCLNWSLYTRRDTYLSTYMILEDQWPSLNFLHSRSACSWSNASVTKRELLWIILSWSQMLDNLREGSSSLYHQDPPKKSWPKSSSLAEMQQREPGSRIQKM